MKANIMAGESLNILMAIFIMGNGRKVNMMV
jgi:hypothetical protein